MSIENLNDESVLRFHENIQIQVAADRASGGRYHVLGNTAKQHADVLREQIDRRRFRADPATIHRIKNLRAE